MVTRQFATYNNWVGAIFLFVLTMLRDAAQPTKMITMVGWPVALFPPNADSVFKRL